jgi:hypothetical protein
VAIGSSSADQEGTARGERARAPLGNGAWGASSAARFIADGSDAPALDGWKASPNPFDSLRPDAPASGAPEGFAESIAAIRRAAQDAYARGKWALAAEQLNAAVWMCSAINDCETCIRLARLLLVCHLAAAQFSQARVLAEQMLTHAHAVNDRALLHTLTTVICLSDCAQMAIGPVLRSDTLGSFARHMDPAVSALLRAGTFSQWLHDDVAAFLTQYGVAQERTAWRYAWTALQMRFERMPESLPLIRMLPA